MFSWSKELLVFVNIGYHFLDTQTTETTTCSKKKKKRNNNNGSQKKKIRLKIIMLHMFFYDIKTVKFVNININPR